MRVTASSVISEHVQDRKCQRAGKIKDIMVNIHTGKIDYLVLEVSNFFGLCTKLFAIPFSELTIDERKSMLIVDRSKEYLKSAPGFDKTHWPYTNLHNYFDEENTNYGMPVLRIGHQ
jgi:sporulation protein YlmC with PRC-barrel domain